MASLYGYIKATDDQDKARAGAIQFMQETHINGLQVMLLHLIQQEALQLI